METKNSIEFEHWRLVPNDGIFAQAASGYFKPSEFADPTSGRILLSVRFLETLVMIRSLCGFPFVINSGYRDAETNARIGGHPNSAHMMGRAADIRADGIQAGLLAYRAYQATLGNMHLIRGIGVKRPASKRGYIHLDDVPRRGVEKPIIWTYSHV